MQRLGLSAECVKTGFIEISGGELRVPIFGEAPWAIIEAFAGDIDIVGIQHAMDKASDHIGCCQIGHPFHRQPKQLCRGIFRRGNIIKLRQAVSDKLLHEFGIALSGHALETANTDMAMAQPDHHCRPCRGWFIAADQLLTGLNDRKSL